MNGSVIKPTFAACMADVNVGFCNKSIRYRSDMNMSHASVMFFNNVNASDDVEKQQIMKEKMEELKQENIQVDFSEGKTQAVEEFRKKKNNTEKMMKIRIKTYREDRKKKLISNLPGSSEDWDAAFNLDYMLGLKKPQEQKLERTKKKPDETTMTLDELMDFRISSQYPLCKRNEDSEKDYAVIDDLDVLSIETFYVISNIIIVCYYEENLYIDLVDITTNDFVKMLGKVLPDTELRSKFIYRETKDGDLEYLNINSWSPGVSYLLEYKVWTFIVSDEDFRKYDQCVVGTCGLKWRKLLFGSLNHVHTGNDYFLLFTTSHDVLGYVRDTSAIQEVNKLLQTYSIRYNIIWIDKNEAVAKQLCAPGSVIDGEFVSNLPNITLDQQRSSTENAAEVGEWEAIWSKNNSRFYYHNKASSVTTWEKPFVDVKTNETAKITLDFKTKDYFNLYKKPARLPLYFDFRSINFCVGDVLQDDHLVYGYDERIKRLKTLKLGTSYTSVDMETYYDIPSKKLLRRERFSVGDIVYLSKYYLPTKKEKQYEYFLRKAVLGQNFGKKFLKIVVFVRSSGVLNGKICPRVYTMPVDAIWKKGHKSKVDCHYEHELNNYIIKKETTESIIDRVVGGTKKMDFSKEPQNIGVCDEQKFLRWDVLQWWRKETNKDDTYTQMFAMGMSCTEIINLLKYEEETPENFETMLFNKKYGLKEITKVSDIKKYVYCFEDYVRRIPIKKIYKQIKSESIVKRSSNEAVQAIGVMCENIEDMSDWQILADGRRWLVEVKSYYDTEWKLKNKKGFLIHDGQPQWRYYYGSSENKESYYRLDFCREKILENPIQQVDNGNVFTLKKIGPAVYGILQDDGWYNINGIERKFFSRNAAGEKADWRSAVTQAIINEVSNPSSDLGFIDVDKDIIEALKNQLNGEQVDAVNPHFSKEYEECPLYGPRNMTKNEFLEMEYKRLKLIYFGLNDIDMPCEPNSNAVVLNRGWLAETDVSGTKTYVRGEEKQEKRPLDSLFLPEEWVLKGDTYYNMRSKQTKNSPEDLDNTESFPIMRRKFVANIYDVFYTSCIAELRLISRMKKGENVLNGFNVLQRAAKELCRLEAWERKDNIDIKDVNTKFKKLATEKKQQIEAYLTYVKKVNKMKKEVDNIVIDLDL